MRFRTVLASEIAALDSDVRTGGGTDDTKALQAVLDEAGKDCGIRLVMDGAALVSGLKVKSNTIIECLNKDCGFYQKDGSDCAIVSNYEMQFYELRTRNVSLIGGSYNQNCVHQVHHRGIRPGEEEVMGTIIPENGEKDDYADRVVNWVDGSVQYLDESDTAQAASQAAPEKWIFGIELYGVENLVIRDIEMIDFRTFGITIGGFKNVTVENVWFTLYHHMKSNQDGLHFWGPGQFLTVKNVGGMVGDDFINIGSDEMSASEKSSITDVLIDGVFLDHADQAIRLLSCGKGRLDRITIRNVTGTYSSFGFYITPWATAKGYGNFGDILIENVNLSVVDEPVYRYRKPFLFSIGCNIECLTLKNIRHINMKDNRTLFEIGTPGFLCQPPKRPEQMRQQNIVIDGLTIIEENAVEDLTAIEVHAAVENLTVKNVLVRRSGEQAGTGRFIDFKESGSADMLILRDAYIDGFGAAVNGEHRVKKQIASDVVIQK